jgi:hypothetical protein
MRVPGVSVAFGAAVLVLVFAPRSRPARAQEPFQSYDFNGEVGEKAFSDDFFNPRTFSEGQ